MKRTLYIAGGFTLAFLMPFNLQAQNTQPKDTTMNRTVVVEQEYNPDILDASKVNVLPKVEEPTVSKKEVEYATTFFPATSIPADLMRPYVGTEVQPGSKPGYPCQLPVPSVGQGQVERPLSDGRNGWQTDYAGSRHEMERLLLPYPCEYRLYPPVQQGRFQHRR